MTEMRSQAVAVLTYHNQIDLANQVRAGVTLSDVLYKAAEDQSVSAEQRARYRKMASAAYLVEITEAARKVRI